MRRFVLITLILLIAASSASASIFRREFDLYGLEWGMDSETVLLKMEDKGFVLENSSPTSLTWSNANVFSLSWEKTNLTIETHERMGMTLARFQLDYEGDPPSKETIYSNFTEMELNLIYEYGMAHDFNDDFNYAGEPGYFRSWKLDDNTTISMRMRKTRGPMTIEFESYDYWTAKEIVRWEQYYRDMK